MDFSDSAVYLGWSIYTHEGAVANSDIPILKVTVKGWFSAEEWECEDKDSYTISFYNESTKLEVEVLFKPQFTNVEITRRLDRFGIVFKSDYLNWWGRRNDHSHRQLRNEILGRIPWHTEAYELIDNELVFVPEPRLVKERRHRARY
jgi:hypothetical protein